MGVYMEEHILDLTEADEALFSDLKGLVIESKRRRQSLAEVIEPFLDKAHVLSHDQVTLVLPVSQSEVWGAGVTYTRSKDARKREARRGEIYDHVYTAERPELFLKDSGLRCVGPGDFIGVRSDSRWTVPEPELALLLDEDGKTLGYTIANDVSARDIEGENPLYLPQAKIYIGCCSYGPVIVSDDDLRSPQSVKIRMTIARAGKTEFTADTNTSLMKRPLAELASYLSLNNKLGELTLLMTGTGIVPPDDFSLMDGDLVEIWIEGIGTLRNPVRKLPA